MSWTNEKMDLYNRARTVPDEAKRDIISGKLKGLTDVNPMWRICRLTELFGPCGLGWWYEITNKWLEVASENDVKAFVDINLFYTFDGEVSKPIPGTGGSSFISVEENERISSDECFKMALTDAISVAAKALGVAADVYFQGDRSKYGKNQEQSMTSLSGYSEDISSPTIAQEHQKLDITEDQKTYAPAIQKLQNENETREAILSKTASRNAVPTTRDEALDFVLSIGKYKTNPKPLHEVVALDPGIIDFYASDRFEPSYPYAVALKEAIKLIKNVA